MNFSEIELKNLIKNALIEDLSEPFCDITTHCLFGEDNSKGKVKIFSKDSRPIMICGLFLIKYFFEIFNQPYELTTQVKDGETLLPKQTLLTITSSKQTLLMLERTLLNFLRHLSAIASLTQQFVKLTQGTNCKILDTRKTTPLLRALEKYAVKCGGGENHRMGLFDMYMLKDTHIDLIGGLSKALKKLPEKSDKLIVVEIRNLEELAIAIAEGQNKIDRVLLDNMPLDMLREAVKQCRGIFKTEASGNINFQTIRAIAETGVDYASVGMLTYSASQVDLSMQYDE